MNNVFATLGAALLLPLSMAAQAASTECNNPSLIDTGNGTVIDRNTGLMWAQCSYGMVREVDSVSGEVSCVSDLDSNGDPVVFVMRTGTALTDAAAATPSGYFATGGHTDWRVPNINELWSIVNDCSGVGTEGFVNPAYFPNQYSGYTPAYGSYPDHFATSTPVATGIIGNDDINTAISNICLQMSGDKPLMGACQRNGYNLRLRLVRDVTVNDYASLPAR
ncbi:DUF1566 domain-containing protein [Thalassolituus sp. LLYu03]|uniref:Lcl domain-containing protein n=1 Tax=Thalassolituus sp. LLYu03 TaxID=3421656 RepID=UPI003D2D1B56